MRSGWIASSFAAFLLIAACVHVPAPVPSEKERLVTLRTFEGRYEQVWDTTLTVLYDDKKIPLKLANKNAGIMASDWIEEDRTVHNERTGTYSKTLTRYRVNVSMRRSRTPDLPANVELVTVMVNKQLELNSENRWQAFPSDLRTETEILAAIGRQLNQYPEKKR